MKNNEKITNISEKQPVDISEIMQMMSNEEKKKRKPSKKVLFITIIIAITIIGVIINQWQPIVASSSTEIIGKDAETILNILSGE